MPVTKFLGKDELAYLIQQLKVRLNADVADTVINNIITTTVPNDSSTDDDVPSSKAVFDAIEAAKFQVVYVTGAIGTVTSPSTKEMYVQRDNAEDTTYTIYVYDGTNFIMVGESSGDSYEAITEEEIDDILDSIFGSEPPAAEPA
jgi:hypothetical protein